MSFPAWAIISPNVALHQASKITALSFANIMTLNNTPMRKMIFLLFMLPAFLFFSPVKAQSQSDSTTVANTVADTTLASLKKQVSVFSDSIKANTARVDSLSSQIAEDSAARARIDSSFSQALDYARRHPEKLYQPTAAHKYTSFFAFLFLLLFLIVSLYYAAKSALLRDVGFMIKDGVQVIKPYNECTFSYSRTQLFWWTLIIAGCYITFFAMYDTLLPLNSTAVILIGSGLATYIFGRTIDKQQIEENNTDKPTRHQDIYVSHGFLTDILSDETGISIHRLQAVTFNIIYGLGYISYFISSTGNTKYPLIDFEQWQFVLLGISAAGYVGIKATSENGKASLPQRQLAANRNPPGVLPPDQEVNEQEQAASNTDADTDTNPVQRDITKF